MKATGRRAHPCWWDEQVRAAKKSLNHHQRRFKKRNTIQNKILLVQAEHGFVRAKGKGQARWNPPSLIRVFAVRMKKPWILSYPLSAQRILWSDLADAQAPPRLIWVFAGCTLSLFVLSCRGSNLNSPGSILLCQTRENLFLPYANNKDADPPVHPHSLISAFFVRCLDRIIHILAIAKISIL